MPVVNSVELVSARRIPVFFAGVQTDSSGRRKTWTPEELDEAAEAYNEAAEQGLHDAPCLHGHRGKHAFGWLEKAYREGQTLFVDLKNVVKDFADGITNKLHPKRSISFYPPDHPNNPTPGRLNINHLAWLPAEGEINPAIKGLPDVSFSDFEGCLEYTDATPMKDMSANDAIAALFQSLRDSLIESDDLETAEKRLPQALIDCVREGDDEDEEEDESPAPPIMIPSYPEYAEMNLKKMMADASVTAVKGIAPDRLQELMNGAEPDDTEAAAIASALKVDVATIKKPKKTTDMSEERIEALEAQIRALEIRNNQLETERERERVTAFVEKLVSDRKVYPTDKAAKIELALSLPNESTVNYSEGSETVARTPREQYLQDLAKGRELWPGSKGMPTGPEHDPDSFTEPGLDDGFRLPPGYVMDPDSQALYAKAKRYQSEKNCEFNEALSFVSTNGGY